MNPLSLGVQVGKDSVPGSKPLFKKPGRSTSAPANRPPMLELLDSEGWRHVLHHLDSQGDELRRLLCPQPGHQLQQPSDRPAGLRWCSSFKKYDNPPIQNSFWHAGLLILCRCPLDADLADVCTSLVTSHYDASFMPSIDGTTDMCSTLARATSTGVIADTYIGLSISSLAECDGIL